MMHKHIIAWSFKFFIFSFIILPCVSMALSAEFESLFSIKQHNASILIDTKADASIPKDSKNILHRLYSQVSKYGEIEVYTASKGKKLIMVPSKRLQIFYKSPISIQILNEVGKPSYIFDLSCNKNNKTVTAENDNIIYLEDVFSSSTLEPLVTYLESSSNSLYTESFITLFSKPKTVGEVLTGFVYNSKIEVKCLISSFPNFVFKSYLCSKLLAYDAYAYGSDSLIGLYNRLVKKSEATTK